MPYDSAWWWVGAFKGPQQVERDGSVYTPAESGMRPSGFLPSGLVSL